MDRKNVFALVDTSSVRKSKVHPTIYTFSGVHLLYPNGGSICGIIYVASRHSLRAAIGWPIKRAYLSVYRKKEARRIMT